MKLGTFLERWCAGWPNRQLGYLKDWHLPRLHPKVASDTYSPLDVFGFDGLNAWCDGRDADDYRFVYAGQAGTWTALHHDVLCSHSWSANVVGRKHWILFPPAVTELLFDGQGNLVPDARPSAWKQYSSAVRASLSQAWAKRVEATQGVGDVVFVPAGWHHQVHNVAGTVSVNHNWICASGLPAFCAFVVRELHDTCASIADLRAREEHEPVDGTGEERTFLNNISSGRSADCLMSADEWRAHVQLLMRANCGIDLSGAVALIGTFVARAAETLSSSKLTCETPEEPLSSKLALFRMHAQSIRGRHSNVALHDIALDMTLLGSPTATGDGLHMEQFECCMNRDAQEGTLIAFELVQVVRNLTRLLLVDDVIDAAGISRQKARHVMDGMKTLPPPVDQAGNPLPHAHPCVQVACLTCAKPSQMKDETNPAELNDARCKTCLGDIAQSTAWWRDALLLIRRAQTMLIILDSGSPNVERVRRECIRPSMREDIRSNSMNVATSPSIDKAGFNSALKDYTARRRWRRELRRLRTSEQASIKLGTAR
eukprot:scaffold317240_cov31-Tisochrysis_lutea.AAC.1